MLDLHRPWLRAPLQGVPLPHTCSGIPDDGANIWVQSYVQGCLDNMGVPYFQSPHPRSTA